MRRIFEGTGSFHPLLYLYLYFIPLLSKKNIPNDSLPKEQDKKPNLVFAARSKEKRESFEGKAFAEKSTMSSLLPEGRETTGVQVARG